jgi:superfamily II DNA or RNA helicase
VPSKHKEAHAFLKRGFFEGLKSFRDFEIRTEQLANTKEVGDAFEILVEAYLYLNPVLNAKDVWLVGEVPLTIRKRLNLPRGTKGIDGVYEDAAGNLIPYQAKYRTDKDTLSYTEVSSFLGVTEESLKDRVIFTNARDLASDISNRKGLRTVRAAQFHALEEEDFNRINAWLSHKKIEFKRWLPQPHQKEAVEKITAELQQASRTTAVMACGTGKTLVALWAAEAQKPKTVLVLVPSLALLSQTLPDWCKQSKWGDRFRYLCVCSDASVTQSVKNDDYELKQSDLEFTVTTDSKQVQGFLAANQSGVNVIFSTYQSAEVVAKGLKGTAIDFGVFDEAHKTTGPKEGLFAFGLSDKNILIKKRLFLTATPRHYDLRKRDKDGDFITISMSDEKVYGTVSYRLSFSAAVAAGIIVPYKVIISVSLNKDIDNEVLRTGSTLVRRNQIQAKWVANQIALKRAIKKTSASKIITFHSRVKLAEKFAATGAQGIAEHVNGFDVFHVNGGQSAADRKATLDSFKSAPRGLITNARCLTEGVDVPSVDMVAFVDPKKSKIDIAQAAGRAMRQSKSTNKKHGFIVVPLFIEQKKGETEAQALARSGYDELAMVLAAMLENDDDLVDLVRQMQEAKGRGEKFNPRRLHQKIEVLGPAIDLNKLRRSIDVEIVDRLGTSWDNWFGLLQKFHKREGHCLVEQKHQEDGLNLGTWVQSQRLKKDRLALDQLKRLNSLGFIWDPLNEQWEKNFAALQKFHKREGHCRVDTKRKVDELRLGVWVIAQRSIKDRLTPDRIKRLNSLDFSWDPHTELWERNFATLQKFRKREGHCRVEIGRKVDGLNLGHWVGNQRAKIDKLTPDQLKRLNSLGFSWDPIAEQWEQNFAALQKFYKDKGHCRVSESYQVDGLKLGIWVSGQRSIKDSLTPDRLKRLNSIGFTWDSRNEQWEQNYAALKKFHEREGHCRVQAVRKVDGLKLGQWVRVQRSTKDSLTPNRLKRLSSLGFSWDPHADVWEQNFAALQKFHKREGHCRVEKKHQEGGLKLGQWVRVQRSTKDSLTLDRVKRLNSLGFTWDLITEQWEQNFAALQKFHKREGHCRVEKKHQEGGLKLGQWVRVQRSTKDSLTLDRVKRLNSLGFIWDPAAKQWEQNFTALQKFRKREGHCCVAAKYQIDGLKLGMWVQSQRSKKDSLTLDRVKRLNSIGFIWDPAAKQWEQNFTALQKFRKCEGHCRVPYSHQVDRLKLGQWVCVQRSRKDGLTTDRLKRLDTLGFSWDPYDEQWEQNFAALQKFRNREGHCLVVGRHKEGGLKLGIWVIAQRSIKDSLTPDRLKRLNLLGFSWDPIAEQWEQAFAALKKFREREGHCRVETEHKEDGLNLGHWVNAQRRKKDRLTPDRLRHLKSLGFNLDPKAEQWEQAFAALQKFRKREGHCRVPQSHEESHIKLGSWASNQRSRKDILTPDRLKRLNSLGFVWR